MFLVHPLVRPDQVEARRYQVELAEAAARSPLLVVLPTGLGKTAVALMVMLKRWDETPGARVLLLAPTKPLVEQHARFLKEVLVADVTIAMVTGEMAPERRTDLWTASRVIVATPQVVHNDIVRGALRLSDFGFLVLDEAHRGVGNYPYVFIARRFEGHRLGLSASPATDVTGIRNVLGNLRLAGVEVRTERDPDVRPYVHEVETEWVRVPPSPEIVAMARPLQRSLGRAMLEIRRLGYLGSVPGSPSRKDILELAGRLRAEASRGRARPGVYQAMSIQARAMKIQHALELCETQGPGPLAAFLDRLVREAERAGGSRAARDWVASEEFQQVLSLAKVAVGPHPKVGRLKQTVSDALKSGARRVLVFANFRETADALASTLADVPGARVERFVGHARAAGERGLTKRQQQSVVDSFRSGDVNVLVATSVGEEGLDLPETDVVVLFEPVPSGIRMIQRRGRTGRRRDGRLIVLMTTGTRDEAYYWSARRREKRMHQDLRVFRDVAPTPVAPPQAPVEVPESAPRWQVVVDTREFQSPVARRLLEEGIRVKGETLEVGDYRIGTDVLVERKSMNDLAASLVDGRFVAQAARLATAGRSILLVEGALDAVRGISRNAVAGAVASAFVDHGLGLVFVSDSEATAAFLAALVKRQAQAGESPVVHARPGRRPVAQAELVRHLFEGLPGVGPVLAARLSQRFGSMDALCRATRDELASVEGVGVARAEEVFRALRASPPSFLEPEALEGLPLQAGDGASG